MKRILPLSLAVLLAAGAHATVLTFDDLGLSNYGAIPDTYGDRVVGIGGPGGSYQEGHGWTPNVQVSYQTVADDGSVLSNYGEFWDSSYGDLQNVIYSAANGYILQITFTADPGYKVVLDSFNAAGWAQADKTPNVFEILSDNSVVWDQSNTLIHGAGPSHSSYAPGIDGGSVTIRLGHDWNTGLDDISFHQQATPEPATMAALGLGALGILRRRRK